MLKQTFLLCVLLIAVAFAIEIDLQDQQPVINKAFIKKLNRDNSATWVAGENEAFIGKTIADVKRHLSKYPPNLSHLQHIESREELNANAVLPQQYNPDDLYPSCAVGIFEDGACGASWA